MSELEPATKGPHRRGLRATRLVWAAVVLAVVLAIAAISTAIAAAPAPGPRLAFVEFRAKPARFELKTGNADRRQVLRLAGGGTSSGPLPALEAPSWSPDGEMLAFAAVGGPTPETTRDVRQVYVVSADGSNLHPLPDTEGGHAPIIAPDGRSVAFYREEQKVRNKKGKEVVVAERSAIWIADLVSGTTTRLTRSQNGLEMYPDSFAPDGKRMLVTRVKSKTAKPEVVALRLDTGRSRTLAVNATGGVYSPDGTRIVFWRPREKRVKDKKGKPTGVVRVTSNLYTMRSNGTQRKKLTRTSGRFETWPSWDPSGQRIAYVSISRSAAVIFQINADGTCRSKLYGRRGRDYYGAAWEPGPGRATGPIAC